MRIREKFDEFANSIGFSPRESRRGYLYGRNKIPLLNQFLLLENGRLGFRAYICSTLFDRWESELGGTGASTTVQLLYLKKGAGNAEALTYNHSNDDDSVAAALKMLRTDFKAIAEPWFESCREQTQPGHLLFEGVVWLDDNSDRLTKKTWDEISHCIREANNSIPHIKHPLFDELKIHLQNRFDSVVSTKKERQAMPKMALKLLEYRCAQNGGRH